MSIWIDTQSGLLDLLGTCLSEPLLAIDTEFMRGAKFFPDPCLLQIGIPGRIWLIDLQAALDFSVLEPLLRHPAQVHVYHACGEDLEILRMLSLPLAPLLFDTQVAASMVGLGFNLSLQSLVEQMLGEKLPKDSTRTDWSQRPLLAEQLDYAAADVVWLPTIQARLSALLAEQQKKAWFDEEMETLKRRAVELGGEGDPLAYLKLRNGWKLSREHQYVLKRLVDLRDYQARSLNVPRKWLCSDDTLLNLVRSRPASLAQLQKVSDIPAKWVDTFGRDLLEGFLHWQKEPAPADFRCIPPPLPKELKGLLAAVRDTVGQVALQHGIPEGMLANRAMIEATVRWIVDNSEWESTLLKGWRGDLVKTKIGRLAKQWQQENPLHD